MEGLRAKPYSYLIDDRSEGKKAQKSVSWKKKAKCENHKYCLEATQPENKINYLEKQNQ